MGYADWVIEQMKMFENFRRDNENLHQVPEDWVPTRYEQKGIAAGRQPIYFVFSKKNA